jgi:hypothetical protein
MPDEALPMADFIAPRQILRVERDSSNSNCAHGGAALAVLSDPLGAARARPRDKEAARKLHDVKIDMPPIKLNVSPKGLANFSKISACFHAFSDTSLTKSDRSWRVPRDRRARGK